MVEQLETYQGKEVVVLGLARSGQAVAKLLKRFGIEVVVNDRKERTDCPEADELEKAGIKVICGGHPDFLIHPNLAFIVKNPGIPYTASPLKQAAELGIEVVTEVEIAALAGSTPLIGITGSNGKTTVTTMTGQMMAASGFRSCTAGNIGTPLTEVIERKENLDWIVCELSSFQLKGTKNFRPDISCILNFSETHLDYHGTMDDYIASKAQIVQQQNEGDIAVLNWDDPICRMLANDTKANVLPFSMTSSLEFGVYLDQGNIICKTRNGERIQIIAEVDLGLPGKHNVQNALAATAIAISAGAKANQIEKVLRDFKGVEHRLERVRELDGITFYNNSKATNITSTLTALEAFDKPVILIAGGLDRGSDFNELVQGLKHKVHAVVALGETRHKIASAAKDAGVPDITTIDNLEPAAAMAEAVHRAWKSARHNEIVLLSPCCASWDMYNDFEERGNLFKQSVHTL